MIVNLALVIFLLLGILLIAISIWNKSGAGYLVMWVSIHMSGILILAKSYIEYGKVNILSILFYICMVLFLYSIIRIDKVMGRSIKNTPKFDEYKEFLTNEEINTFRNQLPMYSWWTSMLLLVALVFI